MRLPCNYYKEIDDVPAISQVRKFTHYEPIAHNLHHALDQEQISESISYFIQNLVLSSHGISVRVVIDSQNYGVHKN